MKGPVKLADTFARVSELWAPKIVAQVNDYHLKIARVQGEFVWHSHPETDEAFLVVAGTLRIDLEEGGVTLETGDLYVVPRGVRHRPVADEECHIMMIEPAGTVNVGDAGGAGTIGDWI